MRKSTFHFLIRHTLDTMPHEFPAFQREIAGTEGPATRIDGNEMVALCKHAGRPFGEVQDDGSYPGALLTYEEEFIEVPDPVEPAAPTAVESSTESQGAPVAPSPEGGAQVEASAPGAGAPEAEASPTDALPSEAPSPVPAEAVPAEADEQPVENRKRRR